MSTNDVSDSTASFLALGDALDAVSLDAMTLAVAAATATPTGPAPTRADVADRLGCAPRHRRLLDRWLSALVVADRAEIRDDRLVRLDIARASTVERAWRRIDALHGTAAAFSGYLRRATSHLPQLLRDEISPHALFFGDCGHTGGAEPLSIALAVYRDNPSSRLVNTSAGDAVAHALRGRAAPRVLEVGAGTGATTESVLVHLDRDDVDYLFTDVSDLFLDRARTRWGSRIRTGRFDIARPMRPQLRPLFPSDAVQVDAIVAANVLHNADNIDAVVAELAELLTPAGVFVLVETSIERPQLLVSTEFLMSPAAGDPTRTPSDARARTGAMFPSVAEWTSALERAGLTVTRRVPDDHHPLSATGQFFHLATKGTLS